MKFSIEQPGGKRCAYGAQAACVAEHSEQHMKLVAKGAHIAMQAKGGRIIEGATLAPRLGFRSSIALLRLSYSEEGFQAHRNAPASFAGRQRWLPP